MLFDLYHMIFSFCVVQEGQDTREFKLKEGYKSIFVKTVSEPM